MKFYEIYSDYATCVFSQFSSLSTYNGKTLNSLIKQGLNINHQFKNYILENGFKNITEEINFYKNIKPKLIGQINALHSIKEDEANYAKLNNKQKLKVFIKIKKDIELKQMDSCLYSQFADKDFKFDKFHFTTLNLEQIDKYLDIEFSNEIGYSCLFGLKVSKIYKLEYLLEYWSNRIANLKKSNKKYSITNLDKLKWTGDKDELIELIYALKHTKVVNNGDITYAELINKFSTLFDIDPSTINPYKVMNNIKNRKKSTTKLIDKMKYEMERITNL